MDDCKPLADDDDDYASAPAPGRAVQVDPFRPTMKGIGAKCLKLKCDKLLSKIAFKFNLRRCSTAPATTSAPPARAPAPMITTTTPSPWALLAPGPGPHPPLPRPRHLHDGRGLHSFTSGLNFSNSRTHS